MSTVKEQGAASIRIELSDGNVSIVHGDDYDLLRLFPNVPEGTWNRMWNALDYVLGEHEITSEEEE